MGYLKFKDVHTLTNSGTTPMTYTLSRVVGDVLTTLSTGTLTEGQSVTLTFKEDGNYRLVYTQNSETTTIEIKEYYNLMLSFLKEVESLLCGCTPCHTCEECNECEDYLKAILQAHAINILNYPLYHNSIIVATNADKLAFNSDILCSLMKEKMYGNAEIKPIIQKMLAYYYMAFYTRDMAIGSNAEEDAYITNKYKYEKIGVCITKLGINLAYSKSLYE